MLTTIHLRGKLGRIFGRKFTLDINTPREAIHAIDKQKPGFRAAILDLHAANFRFHVKVGDAPECIRPLQLDMMHAGREIEIRPVAFGGGEDSKGWGQLIAGIVLIVIGIVAIGTPFGAPLILAGISLAIGGISQLIAGSPSVDNQRNVKNKPSYQFGGPVNVAVQGAPLPLIFGRCWVGSVVGSSSVISSKVVGGTNTIGSTPVDDPLDPAGGGLSDSGGLYPGGRQGGYRWPYQEP